MFVFYVSGHLLFIGSTLPLVFKVDFSALCSAIGIHSVLSIVRKSNSSDWRLPGEQQSITGNIQSFFIFFFKFWKLCFYCMVMRLWTQNHFKVCLLVRSADTSRDLKADCWAAVSLIPSSTTFKSFMLHFCFDAIVLYKKVPLRRRCSISTKKLQWQSFYLINNNLLFLKHTIALTGMNKAVSGPACLQLHLTRWGLRNETRRAICFNAVSC